MKKTATRFGVASVALMALVLAGCASGTAPADDAPTGAPTDESEINWSVLGVTADQQAAMQAHYDAAIDSGNTSFMLYIGHAEEWDNLLDAFEETFPGITIETTNLTGAPLQAALEAEEATGKYVADVVMNPNLNRYADMGFTQSYVPSTFDVDPQIAAQIASTQYDDPNDQYFAPIAILFGMAYNTNLVAPDDLPEKMAEFGDPEWAGKLVSQTPTRPGGLQGIYTQLYMADLIDDSDFERISANTKWHDTDALAMADIQSGAYAVQPFAAASAVRVAKESGAPIDVKFSEFSIVLAQKLGLANGAPSPDAGKLFLDFIMTLEGQKHTLANGYFPLNQDPSLSSPYGYPSLADIEFVPVPDNADINATTTELVPRWQAILGG